MLNYAGDAPLLPQLPLLDLPPCLPALGQLLPFSGRRPAPSSHRAAACSRQGGWCPSSTAAGRAARSATAEPTARSSRPRAGTAVRPALPGVVVELVGSSGRQKGQFPARGFPAASLLPPSRGAGPGVLRIFSRLAFHSLESGAAAEATQLVR